MRQQCALDIKTVRTIFVIQVVQSLVYPKTTYTIKRLRLALVWVGQLSTTLLTLPERVECPSGC